MKKAGKDAGSHLNISGVFPDLAVQADMVPERSECSIGALMPWADRLWLVTYVSSRAHSGSGTGLYEIDKSMRIRKRPESVVGVYANRMDHGPSNQVMIGPHIIDRKGRVRTVKDVAKYRLAATMEHLEDPVHKVYYLSMEGPLLEVDLRTLKAKQVLDFTQELSLPDGCQPHFKAAQTIHGRVIVANNTYDEREFDGVWQAGRLAEWDGSRCTTIDNNPYNEVQGRKNLGGAVFATGWDKASAILRVFSGGKWMVFRLPKASHTFDHYWATEWPRIREIEHERFLMDCHGMFYELSPVVYGGRMVIVRPISTHLRVVPDFCSWRGMMVMGGDQASSATNSNVLCGEMTAGPWFGTIEDLWKSGKPAGWGGPWWDSEVEAGRPSDPYLMTGFDRKCLHLAHDSGKTVSFTVEVDFRGDGAWKAYRTIEVPANGYIHHEFPDGFSAHWVRLIPESPCRATGYFIYT